MPDINFSVGTNAVNMAHDTALVEALLTVVRRSNGRGYMGQYDGRVDTVTRNAIATFQQDHGIVARPGAAATPPAAGARRGAVEQESAGFGLLREQAVAVEPCRVTGEPPREHLQRGFVLAATQVRVGEVQHSARVVRIDALGLPVGLVRLAPALERIQCIAETLVK